MKKGILLSFALAIVLLAVVACSTAPTPTLVPPTLAPQPTALPQPSATTVPPTLAPQPTALPQPSATTVPPTAAPQPTATTALPTAAVAPTTAPATATPTTASPAVGAVAVPNNPDLDKSVATIADAISLSSPSYDTWALPATATADDIFKFYADKLKQAGWTDTGKAGQNPTFGKYTVWQSNDKKSGLVVLYLPNADPTKPTVALAILGTIKTASATATVAPTTAPASPVAPPGLYATAMRLEPAQPAHSQATSFFVTFLNTATTDNNQRWAVYIYKADNLTRRNNETTVLPTTFQPGSVELKSIGTFQIGSTGNPCDYFSARVVTLDQNNKGIELTKPDGTVFEKGFTVCQ